jgi:Type I phosphodiesterase / nucleotide pyrophosphatase
VLPSGAVTAPRLVGHAALAGLHGGLLIALLLSRINPAGAGGPSAGCLALTALAYTAAAALGWPALYGALRFFASHPLRVPRFSLRYLMAFDVCSLTVTLLAFWSTVSQDRRILPPATVDRLETDCLVLSFAWLAAVLVSIVPPLRRSGALQGAAAGLAVAALVLVAAGGGRPPAPVPGRPDPRAAAGPPPAGRLLLLNFDGAALDTILRLQAQGKLPSFSRLREEGAFGRLRSIVPCEAAVTRTTLATGKWPFHNGVRSGVGRRCLGGGALIETVPADIGFDALLAPCLERVPRSIDDRSSLALWQIAALRGGVGVAAGWEIDPDRAPRSGASPPSPTGEALADYLDPETLQRNDATAVGLRQELGGALAADAAVRLRLEQVLADHAPGVAAFSFPGLDRVAHAFLRYDQPQAFGNVTNDEVETYGGVLERYYRAVDAIVGRVMQATGGDPNAVLFVTSSHGMEPDPLRRRILGLLTGREPGGGTHADGPDGFLFARGPSIRQGQMFGKGSLVDLAPTALYALGLPLARDLDGVLLTAVFTPRYVLEHPVAVLGSYETER